MAQRRMTFPAPARCSYETRHGWATRQWTTEDVKEYLTAGGWFTKGRHEFADLQAARAAGVRHDD